MDKKTIILIVLAVVIVGAAACFMYVRSKNTVPSTSLPAGLESVEAGAGAIASSATEGVLPSLGDKTNPLQNQPSINPLDVTNPFK